MKKALAAARTTLAEDNADVRAYRATKPRVSGEIGRSEFATLEDYRRKRSRKRK